MKKQKTLQGLKINADLFNSNNLNEKSIVGGGSQSVQRGDDTADIYYNDHHSVTIIDKMIIGVRIIIGTEEKWY